MTHTGEKPYQNLEMAIFAMVLRRHKPCFFLKALKGIGITDRLYIPIREVGEKMGTVSVLGEIFKLLYLTGVFLQDLSLSRHQATILVIHTGEKAY